MSVDSEDGDEFVSEADWDTELLGEAASDSIFEYREYTRSGREAFPEAVSALARAGLLLSFARPRLPDPAAWLWFRAVGFRLHSTLVMMRNSFRFSHRNRYSQVTHYAFVLSKGAPRTVNLLRLGFEVHEPYFEIAQRGLTDARAEYRHRIDEWLMATDGRNRSAPSAL